MAIKTFTTGEVLTASDTNTYLANSGLVYVTSGALSGTTTDFVGCFTSTYTNYRIVIDTYQPSAASDIYWRMLTNSTPETSAVYSWYMNGWTDGGAASNSSGAGQTLAYTGVSFSVGGFVGAGLSIDMYAPAVAVRTVATSAAVSYPSGAFAHRTGGSSHSSAAAYNGIRFLTAGAPTMSGNCTIYGYRKV